ncbi:DUF2018 family protein [Campylobacter sp. FMV-PI01]|uniref:DUF2018 family protein n=1 Tax=Campylobacter portucalensis TaxID=2608384 RepID=A0A6L5WJR0_9BACT|nr:DUF2018 family protein [Campylobacter portucalensis]MSN95981.1 DUF2018 family protein [Campylobacter portucalensis]
MDIFDSTPEDKFFDIIFNANRNLVRNEIKNLLIKFVAMSEFCDNKGINQDEIFNHLKDGDFIEELNDIFIQISGNILSSNE